MSTPTHGKFAARRVARTTGPWAVAGMLALNLANSLTGNQVGRQFQSSPSPQADPRLAETIIKVGYLADALAEVRTKESALEVKLSEQMNGIAASLGQIQGALGIRNQPSNSLFQSPTRSSLLTNEPWITLNP